VQLEPACKGWFYILLCTALQQQQQNERDEGVIASGIGIVHNLSSSSLFPEGGQSTVNMHAGKTVCTRRNALKVLR